MVIKKNSVHNVLLTTILVGMLFCGSYQQKVPTYMDEFFIILLFLYAVFGKQRIKISNKYILYSLMAYLSLAITTAFLRFAYDSNIFYMLFSSLLNNIKPLLILILFSSIKIYDKQKKNVLVFFLLLNIPSILYSIYQYNNRYSWAILGLKMRDGVGRIEGYSGHPITYAFILVSMVFIIFSFAYKNKEIKKIKKFILYFICVMLTGLAVLTQSRYPIALLVLCALLLFFIRQKYSSRVLYVMAIILGGLFIFAIYDEGTLEFLSGEASTIRMQGVRTGIKTLGQFPLLGCGLGTFGTQSSWECNSYVYELFDVWITDTSIGHLSAGSYFETGFFQKLTENGLLGTACYYYIFYYYLNLGIRKEQYLSSAIIFLFVMNSVLNPLYRLPLVFLVGIFISNLNANCLSAGGKEA